jgi:hypothetical protein
MILIINVIYFNYALADPVRARRGAIMTCSESWDWFVFLLMRKAARVVFSTGVTDSLSSRKNITSPI